MKCKTVIKKFLELDAGKKIPFSIRIHMKSCSRCQQEILRLDRVFQSLRMSFQFEIPNEVDDKIMTSIGQMPKKSPIRISPLNWIFVGILICGSILAIPCSDAHLWLEMHFGSLLDVPIYLIMGFLVSFYAGLITAVHIENVKNLWRERMKRFGFGSGWIDQGMSN